MVRVRISLLPPKRGKIPDTGDCVLFLYDIHLHFNTFIMSDLRIDFKISKKEGQLVLGALKNLHNAISNISSRQSLQRIINEIEEDLNLESIVFGQLVAGIAPVVNIPIARNSNIEFGLGLKLGYRNTTLVKIANRIVQQLLLERKPSKTVKALTRNQIQECVLISDIIKLILDKYETAE